MKKFLFPMVGMLAMAMIAPLPVSASSAANTQVAPFSMYRPGDSEITDEATQNQKLKPEVMAAAQEVKVGDKVSVDLRTADYKVVKLTLNAGQAVRIQSAKPGEDADYNIKYYDDKGIGSYIDDDDLFRAEKAATYYLLVYSQEPLATYFTVEDAMFKDNAVNQKTDITEYAFIPSVDGQYSWTVQCKYTKEPKVFISEYKTDEDGDFWWNQIAPTGENYTPTATATLKAGKMYKISVSARGRYNLTLTKSPAADAVIAKINAIGTVTKESDAAIQAAKAAYNALIPAEQKLVTNAGTISAAEKRFADLTKPSIKKAKIKAVTRIKRKKATVVWKKVAGANGYEVTYAKKKNFKKAKTVKVAATKGKVTLKKLTANKKYYVKVRAYKMYRGQKYYGAYSKVKKFVAK